MDRLKNATTTNSDDLVEQLAHKWQVDSQQVLPFNDFTEAMTVLFMRIGETHKRILIGGHATPEVQIAANRADVASDEVLGASPFVAHPEEIIEQIDSTSEIVYLANPNRVAGSNLSARQIDQIAKAIPDGWLVVDEKYFDYFGITVMPLLIDHPRLVIMRSLSAGFGIESDDSGIMVARKELIADLSGHKEFRSPTVTQLKSLKLSLENEPAMANRLTEIHDESFRLATSLTEKGVQNRITATDFLLLRVADPTRLGNYLARYGTPIENLDGYPEMKNYVKYRVQSLYSNDRFLDAFNRMPAEFYKMKDIDRRAVVFHRQEAEAESDSVSENRLKVAIHRSNKTHKTSTV